MPSIIQIGVAPARSEMLTVVRCVSSLIDGEFCGTPPAEEALYALSVSGDSPPESELEDQFESTSDTLSAFTSAVEGVAIITTIRIGRYDVGIRISIVPNQPEGAPAAAADAYMVVITTGTTQYKRLVDLTDEPVRIDLDFKAALIRLALAVARVVDADLFEVSFPECEDLRGVDVAERVETAQRWPAAWRRMQRHGLDAASNDVDRVLLDRRVSSVTGLHQRLCTRQQLADAWGDDAVVLLSSQGYVILDLLR